MMPMNYPLLLAYTLSIVLLIATNETINGSRSYLYPLIPDFRRELHASDCSQTEGRKGR